jgi:hypothetical protein
MRFFLGVLLALLMCLPAQASMEDVIAATVRVSSQGQGPMGTGCVTSVSDDKIWVLTNAHVVEGAGTVNVEFWRDGHASVKVPGNVTFRRGPSAQIDMALVEVQRARLAGWAPKPIPLAQPDQWQWYQGQAILSAGCAKGAWPTLWEGNVKGRDGNGHLVFEPIPAQGRSGSAITDDQGTKIVALLFAKDPSGPNAKYGYGMTIQTLGRAMASMPTVSPRERELILAQCGPGGCLQNQRPNRQIQLFGRQEITPPSSPSPFPTLPQQPDFPAPPSTDVSGIESKLDILIELQSRGDEPPFPEVEVDPAEIIDQMARDGIAANASRIENVERVVIDLGGNLEEVAEDAAAADSLAGTAANLAGEVAGKTELLEAADLGLAERLAEAASARGLKVTPWLLGLVGGAPLAMLLPIGIAVFLLIRKDIKDFKESGGKDKLMIQHLAEKVTKTTPWGFDDAIGQGISDRVDSFMRSRYGMAPGAPAQPPVVVVPQAPPAPAVPGVVPAPVTPAPPNVVVVPPAAAQQPPAPPAEPTA